LNGRRNKLAVSGYHAFRCDERMTKSDRNIHDLFHDHYCGSASAASWIEYIDRGARVILDRTTIVPNLPRAKILLDVLDVFWTGDHLDNELERQRVFDVFSLLTDCFEPMPTTS